MSGIRPERHEDAALLDNPERDRNCRRLEPEYGRIL
jgi:hypothetical protein